MAKHKGEKVLTGSWAEVWIDGDKIFECNKVEMKITANREDVQIGMDVDSKVTGYKCEFNLGLNRVYSRYTDILTQWQKGHDKRVQIITKLADPDAVKKQIERYSFDNCWFNDIPIVSYEVSGKCTQEVSGGFTLSDMQILDKITV